MQTLSLDARASRATRGSVLVVDDEPLVLSYIQRTLRADGYDVTTAGLAPAALELLGQRSFDLVLSDVSMPGMSGVDLLKEVRRRDGDVPVILVTGKPDVGSAIAAVEHGATRFLTKPVGDAELHQAVEQGIRKHVAVRQQRVALALLESQGQGLRLRAAEASLDEALEKLFLMFQPIVRAADGQVYAHEALLRTRGAALATPDAVISTAEMLGRVAEMGRRVRAQAAQALLAHPERTLFVNLHSLELLDEELYDPASPLSRVASRVVLEITERASLDDVSDFGQHMNRLRALGFRLAVDDLGAGYAGLTAFAQIRPELVKLDVSLVRGIERDTVKQKLVASLCGVCRDLGIPVVAEAVETALERDVVVAAGCQLLQGWLLGRPSADGW